eukprot:TRINITY_DN11110_c0_g1_i3.p1 TRINITY_DN11110_c0_g1~~TRINITY_DN11110_c0_g1_i3.p1  ORF type:complete len:614 (-),score=134.55 TRINITY_DN11110_c0_g1_i3:891-2732(-)
MGCGVSQEPEAMPEMEESARDVPDTFDLSPLQDGVPAPSRCSSDKGEASTRSTIDGQDQVMRQMTSTLSVNSFDNAMGMPDMQGLSLRARLSRSKDSPLWEGGSPEDFLRTARLLLRKQTRGWATPDPEPATLLQPPPRRHSEDNVDAEGKVQLSPGRRRMSEPVLALPRFADSTFSSQELQVALWRRWQKDSLECDSGGYGSKESGCSLEKRSGSISPAKESEADVEAPTPSDEHKRRAPVPAVSGFAEMHGEDAEVPAGEPAVLPSAEEPDRKLLEQEAKRFFATGLPSTPTRDRSDQEAVSKSPLGAELRKAVTEAVAGAGSESPSSAKAHDLLKAIDETPPPPWREPDNVLILLDWDDTLLPTTWLATRGWFKQWVRQKGSCETALQEADERDQQLLQNLDQAACIFIKAASCFGRPFCVTLAQRPWVERSMKAFFPKLSALWEEQRITISYANEEVVDKPSRCANWCQKPCLPGHLEHAVLELQRRSDQKRKVMHRLLRRFYKKTHNSWLNVVSFGDGAAERFALQEIAFWHENPPSPKSGEPVKFRVKSVQLLEEPLCDTLRAELQVLELWLPILISTDEDLDVALGVEPNEDFKVADDELQLLAGL